jgi:hypothetical protein
MLPAKRKIGGSLFPTISWAAFLIWVIKRIAKRAPIPMMQLVPE